jgi:hypothetical protein
MRHVVGRETANARKILIGKLHLNRPPGIPNIKFECELDSSGSGYEPLARFCEHSNEILGLGKAENRRVSDYRPLMDSNRKTRNW